jgi:hypothetical protein
MHVQVRQRTLFSGEKGERSHVMQYGDLKINNDFLATYIGAHPTNINDHGYALYPTSVSQRDARLMHLKTKVNFFFFLKFCF